MNIQSQNTQIERGSILIYALLVLGTLLGITITLTSVFIPKLRSATEAVNSTVSILAADSATEMCLYEARKNTGVTRPIMSNGATFRISDGANNFITDDLSAGGDDCRGLGVGNFTFRAVAEYRNISRALEISQ